MIKEDIIKLHREMFGIKNSLEINSEVFSEYEELGVTPNKTHRSKEEHKKAIFILGEAIADSMSDDEFSETGQLKTRMNELKNETSE